MKTRNILITALCLAVFCLGACSYSGDSDDQGSIRINFDNSGARYAVTDAEKKEMIYTITLTSPGKAPITRKTNKGDTSVSIPVSEGTWNIKVQAEGKRVTGRQQEESGVAVTVTAGNSASKNIAMTITGTRVYNWTDLVEDFGDNSLPNEYSIEIRNDLTAHSSTSSTSDKAINLSNGKTITLWASTNVKITRDENITTTSNSALDVTVFKITRGTLILDGTKGKITVDGNKGKISYCKRALINVEGDSSTNNGILRMRDGVTLTNNKTENGGGVFIKGNRGYFYMEGGTIAGNEASGNGGGVFIKSDEGGNFIKTGGIVYGNEAGDNSNKVTGSASIKGHAVYYSNDKYKENTLDKEGNVSYP